MEDSQRGGLEGKVKSSGLATLSAHQAHQWDVRVALDT